MLRFQRLARGADGLIHLGCPACGDMGEDLAGGRVFNRDVASVLRHGAIGADQHRGFGQPDRRRGLAFG
jgi:hypothetical protein